jgi:hypothetical protein
VLIDTNVILEGKDLKDLPWDEIDPSGPILVLLLPTLLQEVDSKKRDGRLGVRARDFNRLVAPLASKVDFITVRDENPRVDIAFALCSKIQWHIYDELDPNEGDSRLVAEALHIKNYAKEDLILISQDINPLILSRRQGLSTFHLSESWLAKMEQSPHEKELAKLKRQVADYAKTEPEFEVVASLPNEPPVIYSVERLDKGEADALQKKVLEENPRPTQVRDQFNHIGLGGSYDHSLNDRYDKYKTKTVPAFVEHLNEKLELLYGQIPFRFTLKNIGKVRAENLHVEVRCAHGWLNQRVIVSGSYPQAPKAKSSFSPPDFSKFHRPDPPVGRHEVEVEKISKSHMFTAQCAEFRQGQLWEFEGVLWLDPNLEQNTTVVLTVTASNYHGAFKDVLKVPKAIQKAKVFDLIEFDGRAKIHPHTYNMVIDAIDKQAYDLIEWDVVGGK